MGGNLLLSQHRRDCYVGLRHLETIFNGQHFRAINDTFAAGEGRASGKFLQNSTQPSFQRGMGNVNPPPPPLLISSHSVIRHSYQFWKGSHSRLSPLTSGCAGGGCLVVSFTEASLILQPTWKPLIPSPCFISSPWYMLCIVLCIICLP